MDEDYFAQYLGMWSTDVILIKGETSTSQKDNNSLEWLIFLSITITFISITEYSGSCISFSILIK